MAIPKLNDYTINWHIDNLLYADNYLNSGEKVITGAHWTMIHSSGHDSGNVGSVSGVTYFTPEEQSIVMDFDTVTKANVIDWIKEVESESSLALRIQGSSRDAHRWVIEPMPWDVVHEDGGKVTEGKAPVVLGAYYTHNTTAASMLLSEDMAFITDATDAANHLVIMEFHKDTGNPAGFVGVSNVAITNNLVTFDTNAVLSSAYDYKLVYLEDTPGGLKSVATNIHLGAAESPITLL